VERASSGEEMATGRPSQVHGVLVTYARPQALRDMLENLHVQSRPPDTLTVVDNAPTGSVPSALHIYMDRGHLAKYVPSPSNLGPAGGWALGMSKVLRASRENDWILLLDDDDPPPDAVALEHLFELGQQLRVAGQGVGGIGRSGCRLDRGSGRLVRLSTEELSGPVVVDYIAGNMLPHYSVSAIRHTGVMNGELFFGFEDLEYCLRLQRHGYVIVESGDYHLQQRAAMGYPEQSPPRMGLTGPPSWRRYYSIRNFTWILNRNGLRSQALRMAAMQGLAKPLANLPRHPWWSLQHLHQGLRAILHGYVGHLGLTMPPR
jgi:GT2 family glycosyltransferase